MKPLGHVWLIDDDEADNYFHRRVLERSGDAESVVTFTRPDIALQTLADQWQESPDVVLLDINMPGMTGFEFLHALHAARPERAESSKIFVLSTSADVHEEARALETPGVHGYLAKPLSVAELTTLVAG